MSESDVMRKRRDRPWMLSARPLWRFPVYLDATAGVFIFASLLPLLPLLSKLNRAGPDNFKTRSERRHSGYNRTEGTH